MLCPRCNAECADGAVFCSQCGSKISDAETPAAAPAGEAAPNHSPQPFDAATRQSLINQPEEDRWVGRFSVKAIAGEGILIFLGSIALLFLGMYYGGAENRVVWWAITSVIVALWVNMFRKYIYRRFWFRYRLTSQRFLYHYGLIQRDFNPIDLINIDDVICKQGLFGQLFNYGDLTVFCSRERMTPKIDIPGIERPQEIATLIDNTRRTEQMRRRLMITAGGIGGDAGDGHVGHDAS